MNSIIYYDCISIIGKARLYVQVQLENKAQYTNLESCFVPRPVKDNKTIHIVLHMIFDILCFSVFKDETNTRHLHLCIV